MKKKIIFLLAILINAHFFALANDTPVIPENVQQLLKTNFPQATELRWGKTTGGLFIANFWQNDVKHLVYFDEAASFIGTIRYVTTEYMPHQTLTELKKKYGDFGKLGMVEGSLPDGTVFYLVELLHKNKLKTIKVCPNGSTEVLRNMN